MWFRKGVKDSSDKNCVENMKGTGWLRMVNKMKTIAIGPEDRVSMPPLYYIYYVQIHDKHSKFCLVSV